MRLHGAQSPATSVAYSIQPAPRGFAQGTRLLTPSGFRAVELLQAGDSLTDRDGDTLRVMQTETIHVRGQGASVLRIAADACGHGCPEEPVFLTDSAMLLVSGEALWTHFDMDEALVPVDSLANGADIARVALPLGLTWHHLTLSRPAVLVADGLLTGEATADLPRLSPAETRLLRLAL